MTTKDLHDAIAFHVHAAQRALTELETICEREGVNFTAAAPIDVHALAQSLDPSSIRIVRFDR